MDLPSLSIGPEKAAPLDSWWNVTSCSDHNDSNSKFTLLVVVAKMSLSSVFFLLDSSREVKAQFELDKHELSSARPAGAR